MKFCILRSGSSGNATYIECDETRLLLDAGGSSEKAFIKILSEIAITPDQLSGIVNTHLHTDHLNLSTLRICREFNIPIYIHEYNVPVLRNFYDKELLSSIKINSFNDHAFTIGQVSFKAFEVAHDAEAVTSGFCFYRTDNKERFVTYASDLGHIQDSILHNFANAYRIVLECNHDTNMLWKNPRRPFLHKKRVTGPHGHLSNEQTAKALLKVLQMSKTPPVSILLCHLSKDHNTPELAIETVKVLLTENGFTIDISTAERKEKTAFFDVD